MKRGPSSDPNKESKVRRIGEGFGGKNEQTIYFRSWFEYKVYKTSYRDCENDQNTETDEINLGSQITDRWLVVRFKPADCFMDISHMMQFYGEEDEKKKLALPTVFPDDKFYEFVYRTSKRFVIQCHNVDLQEALMNEDIFKRLNLYIPEKKIREIPLWLEKKEIFRIDISEEQALKL